MGTGGREGEGGDWAGLLIAGCDRVCVGDWLGTGGCLWKGVGKKEGVEGGRGARCLLGCVLLASCLGKSGDAAQLLCSRILISWAMACESWKERV